MHFIYFIVKDNIFKTVEDCPTALRQVFQAAQQETVARFPDMKLTVVGGFFFLRFVCPSLVAPEGYGLSEQVPDTKARRSLILVSKILQNLANQVSSRITLFSVFIYLFCYKNRWNLDQKKNT